MNWVVVLPLLLLVLNLNNNHLEVSHKVVLLRHQELMIWTVFSMSWGAALVLRLLKIDRRPHMLLNPLLNGHHHLQRAEMT